MRAGAVTVDGVRAKSGADKVDPDVCVIAVNVDEIAAKKHVYYMLNKPAGVLTASRDKHAQTVMDILPESVKTRRGLFCAGRLDKNTTGLLIVTDDGDFCHRLISPSCRVMKKYFVTVDRPIPKTAAADFEKGVYIDGGHLTLPAKLEILTETTAYLSISEGKYHQVKLMMKKVGCVVTDLHRVSIGGLILPVDLKSGCVRELDGDDVKRLIFG